MQACHFFVVTPQYCTFNGFLTPDRTASIPFTDAVNNGYITLTC